MCKVIEALYLSSEVQTFIFVLTFYFLVVFFYQIILACSGIFWTSEVSQAILEKDGLKVK